MLTIPMQAPGTFEAPTPSTPTTVLVIGRSENVLIETVDILRGLGHTAGATNDFDNVPALFDPPSLNTVVFGGMVPPDTKEALRTRLGTANPNIDFIQGLAGIPGLIAAQVADALTPAGRDTSSVTYDPDERKLKISLESPQTVRLTGFWATTLAPPEPKSTSQIIFNETLQPGSHTLPLPDAFPTAASFVVVHAGTEMHLVTVGPMPRMDILPPPA